MLTKRSWGQQRAMKAAHTSGSSNLTSLCAFHSSSVRSRAAQRRKGSGQARVRFPREGETGWVGVPVPMSSSRRARCASMALEGGGAARQGGETLAGCYVSLRFWDFGSIRLGLGRCK